MHAAAQVEGGALDEYLDRSSIMGGCCEMRCPNTPHAWQVRRAPALSVFVAPAGAACHSCSGIPLAPPTQLRHAAARAPCPLQLGWLPVQELDGTSLKPGQTRSIRLLAQSSAGARGARSGPNVAGGVRIKPTWVAGADPIFVGFRTRGGGDRGLPSSYVNRVHVYTSPVANTFDSRISMWRAGLVGGWPICRACLGATCLRASPCRLAVSVCLPSTRSRRA